MATAQVLTDASLFRQITAFQRGLPMPLFEFWCAHSRSPTRLRLTHEQSYHLVCLLVAHGTPALLAMAARVRYSVPRFGGGPNDRWSLQPLPLDETADLALWRNRLDIVEWALVTKTSPLRDTERAWLLALSKAYADGDTHMLDVLKTHTQLLTDMLGRSLSDRQQARVLATVNRQCVQVFSSRTQKVSDPQRVSVLRWLVEEIPGFQLEPSFVDYAADQGDLPLLRFLHARGIPSCGYSTLAKALTKRRLAVLECLLELFTPSIDPSVAMMIAMEEDPEVHRIALQFAEKLQVGCAHVITHPYPTGNCIQQVQRWIERGILLPQRPISIDIVASNGKLDMLRLLHDHGIATATTDAMDSAAEKGHWHVVDFLHHHRSEGCTTRAMDAALEQGNLKYVRFLFENRREGFSPHAAEKAASSRSTDVIRFLHTHTDVVFTPAVMDKAASCGNVAVVKFLDENRSEGCTTAAMDGAACHGHVRVLQYLHRHRSEGCTIAAVRASLENGSLQVLRFLYDNYRELFELEAFDELLVTRAVSSALKSLGDLKMAQFLFDRFPHLYSPDLLHDLLLRGMFDIYSAMRLEYPEQAESVVDTVLYEAGRTLELRTIRYIVELLGRQDLAHRAMDGAASSLVCGRTHWLRAVYAITGPQSCRLSAVQLGTTPPRRGLGLTPPRRGLGSSREHFLDSVLYLISVCCEPGAREVAIAQRLIASGDVIAEQARTTCELPLHVFLVDPRVSSWALKDLFDCSPSSYDPVRRVLERSSWPIQAACHDDVLMLEVLRDMAPTPNYIHASHDGTMDADAVSKLLSFEGTRAAAIRAGSVAALQWLLKHSTLPVEPTLLGEALFYDQREIAQWLADHHPEACTQVYWEPNRLRTLTFGLHLNEDVLDWLDEHDAVRNVLDFEGVVDYLVRVDDVDALRLVHAWNPDLVMKRTNLLALKRGALTSDVVAWLQEVGYHEN